MPICVQIVFFFFFLNLFDSKDAFLLQYEEFLR
jgi:hypothetical protein